MVSIYKFNVFVFQIIRSLELPAEKQRVKDLREIVKFQRNQFITSITNNSDIGNLDHLVTIELAKYEQVSLLSKTIRIDLTFIYINKSFHSVNL